MASATVRISETSRKTLKDLAAQENGSMQAVLEKAIEHYRRRRFLEQVNTAYAALQQDRKTWTAVEKERVQWDATLGDGLEPDEEWTEDGKAIPRDKRTERR